MTPVSFERLSSPPLQPVSSMNHCYNFDTKSESKSSTSSFNIDADGSSILASKHGSKSFVMSESKWELPYVCGNKLRLTKFICSTDIMLQKVLVDGIVDFCLVIMNTRSLHTLFIVEENPDSPSEGCPTWLGEQLGEKEQSKSRLGPDCLA